VRAVQHVFRRGAVYWWRRRLLHKDGESARAPIAFSLRTRDLSRARSIAAHIAVASDGILRQEGREMLSAAQARSMLEAVARAHLAKMERVAVMETADGVTADEGRSSDRVMGWVRRLQAAQGTAAIVGALERRAMAEYGLNQQEIDEVGQTLDLLRRASNGTSPRQRLVTFLEQCGASLGEGDLLQAERIYYRGQAAALLATDRRWSGDFREDDALIDQLLRKQPPGDLQAPTPTVSNVPSGPVENWVAPPPSEAQAAQDPPTKETSITKLTENRSGSSRLGACVASQSTRRRSASAGPMSKAPGTTMVSISAF
jgi:hypothetical protein